MQKTDALFCSGADRILFLGQKINGCLYNGKVDLTSFLRGVWRGGHIGNPGRLEGIWLKEYVSYAKRPFSFSSSVAVADQLFLFV